MARVAATPALELRGPFDGVLPRYFLRNVTAGLLDGDVYEVDLHLAEDARVSVSPTSAAKVFVGRVDGSSLSTRIEIERGAVLDYDAGLTIPHAGAIARQSVEIVLHEGGRVAFAEVFAFGRLAHGERFAFERFDSQLVVRDAGSVTRFARRSVLVPSEHPGRLDAAVGAAGVLGSLLLLGEGERPVLPTTEGVYAGASSLPGGLGWQVQALAARAEQAEALLSTAGQAWVSPPPSDATTPLSPMPVEAPV